MIIERVINEYAFEKYGLTEFLIEKGLFKSAMFTKGYNPTIMHELYSNLTLAINTLTVEGYHHVFVREKMVGFTPDGINEFLEFPTKIENDVFEEGFEYTAEVIKEITCEKYSSWGPELRFSASQLIVKYNVLFRLAIFNWFPTAHNSCILKDMALLLYAMVIGGSSTWENSYFRRLFKNLGKV